MDKGDVSGHLEGKASRKGGYLFMNVGQEGLGLPAAQLLDGMGITAVEMESHSTASSQGVAADVGRLIAHGIETNGVGGGFEGLVDVVCSNMPWLGVQGVFHGVNGSVKGAMVAHDMEDTAGQRSHGAVLVGSAVLVDGLAFDTIFLSWDHDSGGSCLIELVKRGSVGDDLVVFPEGNVLDCKGNGVADSSSAGRSVFANSEEVVKGNVAEIGSGLSMCTGARGLALLPVSVQ